MLAFSQITYEDGQTVDQLEVGSYLIDYHRGGDKLVVTFESAAGLHHRSDKRRKPWGFDFLAKGGFSILAVKTQNDDWYRGPKLHSFLRSDMLRALTRQHSHVFLYGGSMGGYAALAFAEAFPGCTVIALNPQSTLNLDLVPWEKRFTVAQKQDWRSDFYDGKNGSVHAAKVYVIYDPFFKPDRMHVERLDQSNLIKLRIPFVGHEVPKWMLKMGALKPTVEAILSDTLRENDFREMVEARKKLPRYYAQLAKKKPWTRLARTCVDKALSLDPTDQDALSAACKVLKVLLAEGRYEEALSTSEKLPTPARFEYAIHAYLQLGMVREAKNMVSSLLMDETIEINLLSHIKRIAEELGYARIAAQIARERRRRKSGAPRV